MLAHVLLGQLRFGVASAWDAVSSSTLTEGKMKNRTIVTLLFGLLLLVSSVLACKGLGGSSSPTATYKAFFEAQKRKDLPGMKQTLSKGSLAMLEQGAKEQKKTLDDSLKEGFDDPAFKAPTMPPTRNEKIDGDSATLEVQNEKSKDWEALYFVKEDGEWKFAIDKTLEELFKKMGK